MNQAKLPLRSLLVAWVIVIVVVATSGSGQQTSPTPSTSGQGIPNGAVPEPVVRAPSPWVVGGHATASALQRSVLAMYRRKRHDEIEPLVERMVRQHPSDWRVLFQGARIYAEIERAGYWINGRYKRGELYGNVPRGARKVYSHRRDHTRALQLLDRAIRSMGPGAGDQEMADFYWEAAQILVGSKAYYGLYELTPLTSLPSLEFHEPRVPLRETVPLDNEGAIQYFQRPESWDVARNDGERLLWLLERARSLSPQDYEAEAEYIIVKYLLKSYLGVQAIAESSDYDPLTKEYVGDEDAKALVAEVHTLSREETLVRVPGGGLRRVTLPEQQNFIHRFTSMTKEVRYATHAALALEELAEVFENRRQYERAATYWQEAVTRFGNADQPSWENDRLEQILKSWGQFEDLQPVQVDDQAVLRLWYRNGKKASLTARRIDVDALVADIQKYLGSDPFPVNPDRISVSKLGLHLVSEGREKYLKKTEAEWEVALEPRPNHWDNRVEIPVPFRSPGAYMVEATIDDSHACSTVVWINDMTILRRSLEDGLFFYVADKRHGKPVSWAKFSFIGFRLEVVPEDAPAPVGDDGEEVPHALRRQYHVKTKEITKWADAKGQLILDDGILNPDYRWFLLTTAPGNRAAILGFSDLKPTGTTPKVEEVGVQHFIVADRPVYLPGQMCYFRGWLRDKRLAADEGFSYVTPNAGTVHVSLLGPNDEILAEQSIAIDEDNGGFTGSFELKKDWLPGHCQIQSSSGATTGLLAIEIGSPKLEQTQLALTTERRGTGSKQRLETFVKATATGGEWLSGAEIRYEVHQKPHRPKLERSQDYAWLYGHDYQFTNNQVEWFLGWKYWGWDKCKEIPHPVLIDSGGLVLNDEGTGVVVTNIDVVSEKESVEVAFDYEVSVELDDEKSVASASTTTTVSPRPFKIFATLDRPYYRAGDEPEFAVWVRDYVGKPVTGSGKLIIYEVTFDSDGGPQESNRFTADLTLDSNGELREKLPPLEVGQYRVCYILADSKGVSVEGAAVSIVVDDSWEGTGARFNAFEILSDKTVYQPGDTAKIRLNSDRAEQSVALFVRPRNGVFGKAEVLRLESKSTSYEIVIQEGDAPSFFVEAIILNDGEFEVHTKEILVSPPTQLLKVSLATEDAKIRPGKAGNITLQLRDANGKPVAGQAALTLQPSKVLAEFDSTVDIRKTFWDERRPYEPSVEHALQTRFQSFSRPPTAFMRPIGIFGSMRLHDTDTDTDDPLLEEAPLVDEPASEFVRSDPSAAWQGLWLPDVTIGDDGQVDVPVTWPAVAGDWTIQVWAMGANTHVGQTRIDVSVEEPWSLDLKTPDQLMEGDSTRIVVKLRSERGGGPETPVTLALSPGLAFEDGTQATQSVALDTTAQTVTWRLEATGANSQGEIELTIGDGVEATSLTRRVAIAPREHLSERWWNAQLTEQSPDYGLEFSLPERCHPVRTVLQVRAGSSVLESLLLAFDDAELIGESAEAIVYRLFPLVRVHRYVTGLEDPVRQVLAESKAAWLLSEARIEQMVESGLSKLGELQNDDGGWSWSAGESQALTTATVLTGLRSLEGSNMAVPKEMVSDAVRWLRSYQKVQNGLLGARNDGRKSAANTLDAFVYMALLDSGFDSSTMRNFLMRDWKKLPNYGKVLFATGLHIGGHTEDRNTIRFELGEELNKEENGAIHLTVNNQEFWWTWYGSSVETQASYLKFLIAVKGDSPVTDAVAQHVLSSRSGSEIWNPTRDSAFALEALVAYVELKKQTLTRNDTEQRLALVSGENVLAESVIPSDAYGFGHSLELRAPILTGVSPPRPPTNDATQEAVTPPFLKVVSTGSSAVDMQAHLSVSETPNLITQSGNDFAIQRSFHLVQSDAVSEDPLPPGAVISVGQTVEVMLRASASRPMEHVCLTDFIPGGCEVVGDIPQAMRQVGNRLELALIEFPKTPTQWRYRIRAMVDGEYSASSAFVQADYHRCSKAWSDEMILVIRGTNGP